MAYDQGLTQRIRDILVEQPNIVEKKMFGGLAFMGQGNYVCGVSKEHLVVRVGKQRYQESLAQPHARVMDITGRVMNGWVYVSPEGCADDTDLQEWVQLGVDYAYSLPPK